MLSAAKSANVVFQLVLVVQLFAPATNPALRLHLVQKVQFISALFLRINNVVGFSRVRATL